MHFPTWHREGSGESPTIPVMDFMGSIRQFSVSVTPIFLEICKASKRKRWLARGKSP